MSPSKLINRDSGRLQRRNEGFNQMVGHAEQPDKTDKVNPHVTPENQALSAGQHNTQGNTIVSAGDAKKQNNPAMDHFPSADSLLSPAENKAPVTDINQIIGIGKAILKKINPDGSPVTERELDKAMDDPSYKGQDAQVMTAMYAT